MKNKRKAEVAKKDGNSIWRHIVVIKIGQQQQRPDEGAAVNSSFWSDYLSVRRT